MVVVVLDTVSLCHLLRTPRRVKPRDRKASFETALDRPMEEEKLSLALDTTGGLVSEWQQTCGEDVVGVVLTRWVDLNAILYIDKPSKLGTAITKKLRQLGFDDTIDKLILRIAGSTVQRTVVSDDNDFWDPRSTKLRGNRNARVAKFCREELNIVIMLVGPLLKQLG